MSPVEQALYILDKIDRNNESVKNDILIKSDPRFMVDFRRRIWPIIATYCATASCHGGDKPMGGLRLFNIPGKNEKIDYMNFLILDRAYHHREMIDRDHKEMSLLLQFGLPAEQAQYRHPIEIKIAYATRRARNYRRVLEWIESLKGPPHPDYRVGFRIPWAPKDRGLQVPGLTSPATQPADQRTPEKPPI